MKILSSIRTEPSYRKPFSNGQRGCIQRPIQAIKTEQNDSFTKSQSINPTFCGHKIKIRVARLLNRLPFVKLSKHDTPAIKQLRQKVLDNAVDCNFEHLINLPERIQLRQQIVAHIFEMHPEILNNRNFYVVVGVPGAGKTTMSDIIAQKQKALHIDNDEIKFEIPEFKQNPLLDFAVNEEADMIRKNLLHAAMQKGSNIVIEFYGFFRKPLHKLIETMKAADYKVHLIMIDVPIDKAVHRSTIRYKETGRFSDPLFHSFYGHRSYRNYERLVKQRPDLFSSFAHYSNDVPKGEPFKLVSGSGVDFQSELVQ